MSKRDALAAVRSAAAQVGEVRSGPEHDRISALREANAQLALAQIAAEQAGATGVEIDDASEWEGVNA